MGTLQNGSRAPKSRLARGLTLAFTFSLLSSFAFALWANMTNDISAVLNDEDIALLQLEKPEKGTPLAVMHTTAGDLTYALYPEECPQTVENFCNLAKQGYYNDTYVFRIEPEIFFSAGSKTPEGTLGGAESDSPQEQIPQELSPKLWPLRGALCALETKQEGGFWKTLTKSQTHYTGSRFLTVDTIEMTEEIKKGMHAEGSDAMNRVADAFAEHGGIPNYAQQITVFGQLQEGFEVLDAITEAKVTGESGNQKPAEEIRITGIEITEAP